jgi:hypothetical protein
VPLHNGRFLIIGWIELTEQGQRNEERSLKIQQAIATEATQLDVHIAKLADEVRNHNLIPIQLINLNATKQLICQLPHG